MDKQILIVDDSSSMREMVKLTLAEAGYAVVEAENGEEALGQLSKNSVNMVLTDLNMPVMDGMELIRSIRKQEDNKFLPIVMLTTESEISKKEEGRSAGANGWLVKPFVPEKLLMVVKKVVG